MSESQLTRNALYNIMRGTELEDPILQIIGSKRIESQSAEKSRYRILLSDGKYKVSYAMYTAPPNHKLVENGEIIEHTIVKVKKSMTSTISAAGKTGDKRVLILLDVEVVKDGKQVGTILGNPIPLPNDLSQIENKENSTASNSTALSRASNDYEPAAKKPNVSNAPPELNDSTYSSDLIMPIVSLTPYNNKWVIKARVTTKGPVRTWSNSKGEGKLFSFDLVDQSGEIRVTAFREAVDKYYEFLEVDKIYYVSRCQVKMANKKFSSLKNDYELTLGHESVIQECKDEADDLPSVQYNFTVFEKIADIEANTLIDIIGICKQIGDVQSLTARSTGRELKKRDVVLVDQSKCSIALTLWGNDAENFEANNDVVAVKGARVTEFGGGKSVTVPNGGTYKINPDVKEAFVLRGWYDNGGNREDASNLSARTTGGGPASFMCFKQAQIDGLGSSERGDYYMNVASILMVRSETLAYEACASESCSKKVINLENGRYRCEKCNIESAEFKYRLIGNMNVCDWSGSKWVTVFNPDCEFVFGATAQQIGEGGKGDSSYIQNLTNEANFKQFQFKYRVKTENFNDDSRLQTSVVKVEPLNYKTYNSQLISQIQQLTF